MSPARWVAITELAAFLMTGYGLSRQSFTDLADKRPFGEGRFGEGAFGRATSRLTTALVSAGMALRLVPSDASLSLTDRRQNAAWALSGLFLGAGALLYAVWLATPNACS